MAEVEINRSKVGRAVGNLLEPEVRKRLQIAVDRARDRAGYRSGELRDSIGYEIIYSGSEGVRGRLYATAQHAQIIHEGRGEIRTDTPMVFIAPSGSKVFTQVSAAVPANPFLTDAVRSTFGGSYSLS